MSMLINSEYLLVSFYAENVSTTGLIF